MVSKTLILMLFLAVILGSVSATWIVLTRTENSGKVIRSGQSKAGGEVQLTIIPATNDTNKKGG